MRRLGRTGHADGNQVQIVAALRKAGASVLVLSGQGFGCFDLLVGFHGQDFPMELKNGALSPSKRLLTDREIEFSKNWRGRPIAVVESVDEALGVIGVLTQDVGSR